MLLSRIAQAAMLIPVLTEAAQAHEAPLLHSHIAGAVIYTAVGLALAGMLWAAAPFVAGAVGRVRRQRHG